MKRDVFVAIADPTRRAILALLAVGAATPNALAARFQTSRQAVSKHLRILTECGLVQYAQTGREIHYHLDMQKVGELEDWIGQLRGHWQQRLDQLDDLLKGP